ncbi:MAG: ferrochelatase [Thermosulfidibacteraceae bacterium]|jgi:ferrochelatase
MLRYVVIVNSGAVEDYKSYILFLYRMFTDPKILDLPLPVRYLVATIISIIRPIFGYSKYRMIGKNPLIDTMKLQSERLGKLLEDKGFRVLYSNLYSQPLFEDVIKEIPSSATIVVIPQFPQYSSVTTGSIEYRLNKFKGRRIKLIKSYYKEELFVRMWKEAIWNVWDGEHIVFVAHSIPQRLQDAGDPYVEEFMESARLISEALGVSDYSYAFSSPFPLGRWVGPFVQDVVSSAIDRYGRVLVVPISFVNEHFETIYDFDIVLRNLAIKRGVKVYKRVKVPYDSPYLIELYKKLVLEVVDA